MFVLFIIWLVLLVLLHIAVFGVWKLNIFIGALIVLVWWGVMIGVGLIYDKLSAKRDRKKKQLYKEKYITEVTIEDEFFGTLTFENDSNKGRMECADTSRFPKFGADVLDTLCIMGYNDGDREKIFRSLRGIYEHQSEIIDLLCPELFETADEYEETDENGEPYTPEKIRERVYISWTSVYNSAEGVEVVMECGLTEGELELGGHGFEVEINCAEKTLDFNMEG